MIDRIPHDWVDLADGPWFIGSPQQEYKITLEELHNLFVRRKRLDNRCEETKRWRNKGRISPSLRTPKAVCDVLNRIEEDRHFKEQEEVRRDFASYLEQFAITKEDSP